MDGWRAVLGPADVHAAVVQLDLMPLEIADLGGSQSMTIGDQNHGRVSMSVAAVLAGIVHELFDLAGGQVVPGLARVAVLSDPLNPSMAAIVEQTKAEAVTSWRFNDRAADRVRSISARIPARSGAAGTAEFAAR